jgi:SAM-dependent methyltransferase
MFDEERKETRPMSPYKVYGKVNESDTPETLGQDWRYETLADTFQLCECETTLPVFLKYLPREGRILESGCGTGRWVFYFRQKGFDITGIDLAPTALERAKAYDPSAPVLLDDVLHSQFPDGTFDAAISLGVVEHFEEGPQGALAELLRILRDGGILLISVPISNIFRRFFVNHVRNVILWYRRRKGVRYAFAEYRYTPKQFRAYLQEAGFEIFEVFPQDLLPPKALGLYIDFDFLNHKHKKLELNAFGSLMARVFRSISPWIACSGALWVCKKRC